MADYTKDLEQLVDILLMEFNKQFNGSMINPHVKSYWSKLKTRLEADVVTALEQKPMEESSKELLNKTLAEKFTDQRFLAHTAMFMNQSERTKK